MFYMVFDFIKLCVHRVFNGWWYPLLMVSTLFNRLNCTLFIFAILLDGTKMWSFLNILNENHFFIDFRYSLQFQKNHHCVQKFCLILKRFEWWARTCPGFQFWDLKGASLVFSRIPKFGDTCWLKIGDIFPLKLNLMMKKR